MTDIWKFFTLVTAICITFMLLALSTAQPATYHVSTTGNDSAACGTAPRRTINKGMQCMASGDTLIIQAGEYPELLVGVSGSTPPLALTAIPNGTAERPTKIIGQGVVWIKPTTSYPGGGGILTTFDRSQYIHIEGLSFDAQRLHTYAVLTNSNDITLINNEMKNALASGLSSTKGMQHIYARNNIHHNGSDGKDHGMYICGTNKIIEHNQVHHNTYGYGIHVSCESGGIRDIIIRYNYSAYNGIRGIQIQGQNNHVHDNVLYKNGVGIGINGSNMIIAHNTIASYLPLPDNWGIIVTGDSTIQVKNNLIMDYPVRSFGSSGTRYIYWGSGTKPTLEGNTCDALGMGCQKEVQGWQDLVVSVPNNDLHLIANSPAINAGVQLNMTPDFAGLPRTTPDSGAYAWQYEPVPPDPTPDPNAMTVMCKLVFGDTAVVQSTCVQLPLQKKK